SAYAASSPTGSASSRVADGLPSMSSPPMPAFRATNWSGVIAPDFSADSPYWTPTLSSRLRTNPVFGSRPSWLTTCSVDSHLTPVGLVGLQRIATGTVESQLSVGVARLANVASHERQES